MVIEHVLTIIAAVFACTGFWELVRYLIDKKTKSISAEQEAHLAVLHELIYPKLEKAVIDGKVGIEELDRIDTLYQPYKKLGGNGIIERRYNRVHELPIFDDQKIES